jgi:hypothetical protein
MEEKKQEEKEITLKDIYDRILRGMQVTTFGVVVLEIMALSDGCERDKRFDSIDSQLKKMSRREIVLPVAAYINSDSLMDLDFEDGRIYLQTFDGKFVEYNQAKEDSIFRVKEDSIKKVYEKRMNEELYKIQKIKQ